MPIFGYRISANPLAGGSSARRMALAALALKVTAGEGDAPREAAAGRAEPVAGAAGRGPISATPRSSVRSQNAPKESEEEVLRGYTVLVQCERIRSSADCGLPLHVDRLSIVDRVS